GRQVGPLLERLVDLRLGDDGARFQRIEARVREVAGCSEDGGALLAGGVDVAPVQSDVGLQAQGVEVEAVVVVSREVALLEPDALQVESLPGRGEALLEGSLPRRQAYEAGGGRAGVGRGPGPRGAVGAERGLA